MEYSLESFKEPRGFLKLLEWLFAICAFASTLSFSTEFGYKLANVKCANNSNFTTNIVVTQEVNYPFALDHEMKVLKLSEQAGCKGEPNAAELKVSFVSNVKSDSEFFVTTGVLCFLYSTALIAVYLFADKLYYDNTNIPIIDFIFTLVFAIFWLSGSAAWANGLSDLKMATNPKLWENEIRFFEPANLVQPGLPLIEARAGVFAGLVISILFGFINFILWAANLWFVYKESTWFESIMKNAAPSTSTTTGA